MMHQLWGYSLSSSEHGIRDSARKNKMETVEWLLLNYDSTKLLLSFEKFTSGFRATKQYVLMMSERRIIKTTDKHSEWDKHEHIYGTSSSAKHGRQSRCNGLSGQLRADEMDMGIQTASCDYESLPGDGLRPYPTDHAIGYPVHDVRIACLADAGDYATLRKTRLSGENLYLHKA